MASSRNPPATGVTRLELVGHANPATRPAINCQCDIPHWNYNPGRPTFALNRPEQPMTQPISKPLQKWAATMTLVALEVVLLIVVGLVLFAALPASEFGTILAVLALLAIALSLLTARVIRWLSED